MDIEELRSVPTKEQHLPFFLLDSSHRIYMAYGPLGTSLLLSMNMKNDELKRASHSKAFSTLLNDGVVLTNLECTVLEISTKLSLCNVEKLRSFVQRKAKNASLRSSGE